MFTYEAVDTTREYNAHRALTNKIEMATLLVLFGDGDREMLYSVQSTQATGSAAASNAAERSRRI